MLESINRELYSLPCEAILPSPQERSSTFTVANWKGKWTGGEEGDRERAGHCLFV